MLLFEHQAAGELTELQRLRRAAEDNTEPPQLLYSSNELTYSERRSLDSETSSYTNCVSNWMMVEEHSPGLLPPLHLFSVS